MHLDHALARLSEIHAHVLRSAVYRGYSACAESFRRMLTVVSQLLPALLLGVASRCPRTLP